VRLARETHRRNAGWRWGRGRDAGLIQRARVPEQVHFRISVREVSQDQIVNKLQR